MIIPYFVLHGTHQPQKLSDNHLMKTSSLFPQVIPLTI
ncbi:MAG: hypothetical protein ACI85I_002530, partial [Arenicella sp.]